MESFSIICFGNQWDKYMRRYRSIMSRLATFPDVESILYIEPALPLTSLAKYVVRRVDQDGKNWWERIFKSGLILKEGSVTIVPSICLLPFYRRSVVQSINIGMMNVIRNRIAKRYRKARQNGKLVVWIGHPYFTGEFAGRYGEDALVYDLCDDYREKYPAGADIRRVLTHNDEKITSSADLIFVTNETLYRQKIDAGKTPILLPNGVDVNAFNEVGRSNNRQLECISSLDGPVLTYIGRVDPRIDADLLHETATCHPDWNILLVGPRTKGYGGFDTLDSHANVYFTGDMPYDVVPTLLSYTDICILPHRDTPLTRAMDPMKIYSYLASGKPVVSTRVTGATRIQDVISVVEGKNEFIQAVERELQNDSLPKREARRNLAEEHSWDNKVALIHDHIVGVLHSKNSEREKCALC